MLNTAMLLCLWLLACTLLLQGAYLLALAGMAWRKVQPWMFGVIMLNAAAFSVSGLGVVAANSVWPAIPVALLLCFRSWHKRRALRVAAAQKASAAP